MYWPLRHVICASFATGLLLVAACKEKAAEKPPPTAEVKPPPAPAGVGLFVNETKITDLDRSKAETWPRLDSLLPAEARRYGTWEAISGKAGAGGTAFEIKKPGSTYGALVPALYPAPSGKGVSLGLFDPVELAKKGAPKVSHDELTELRVELDKSGMRGQNDHQGGDAIDPNTLKLEIEAGGKTVTLTGAELLALPRENAPDDDSGEHKGWRLAALLGAAKAGPAKRVLLSGEEMNLTLEQEDLDPKAAVPFIKLNRQGSLRFRVYKKQGDGWAMGADLRGLRKVQVLQ
jgi:hypothetical protein